MRLIGWPNIGGPIQRIIDDVRRALEATPEDPIIEIAVTSGTESKVKITPGQRPRGFLPCSAVDPGGVPLTITSWSFNRRPKDSNGVALTEYFGVTVTFVAGTTGTLTGRVVV